MIKKCEQNQEFAPNARFAPVLGGGPKKVGQKGQKGHIVVFIDNFFRTKIGEFGRLNPTWVEWLMGFPPGHTDLDA